MSRPSRPRRLADVALLAFLAAGCGGGSDGAVDAATAPSDALFVPAECDIDFGFTHVYDMLEQFPAGEGVDIDDDGLPDNHLAPLRPLFNASLEDGFARGTWIFLMELTDWDGPPVADDPDVTVSVFNGFDADSPPNLENDFSGDGEFLVDSRQLDVNCGPQAITYGAVLENRRLEARPEEWKLQIEGVGVFPYADMRVTVDFSPDFKTFEGAVGGVWLPCNLYKATGPDYPGGTLLGVIVNSAALPQTDIDRDGDGLESFEGDGNGIKKCYDGDGTEIDGPDCACDPRIVDGYSVSFRASGITASIVGVLQVD